MSSSSNMVAEENGNDMKKPFNKSTKPPKSSYLPGHDKNPDTPLELQVVQ